MKKTYFAPKAKVVNLGDCIMLSGSGSIESPEGYELNNSLNNGLYDGTETDDIL